MADRLNPLDVSFLYLEGRTTPMHVGGLAVFEPPSEGFDYDTFVDLIEHRISLVPRYRQKVRSIPGHLANPVWVDDGDFDLGYHVRRSALPAPAPTSSCGSWSPGCSRGRWTATARCGRCIWSRGWPVAGSP